MLNKKVAVICFTGIMILWIAGSQEMYHYKAGLQDAVVARYFIYLAWLFGTGCLGYFTWMKYPLQWAKQVWLGIYAIAFIILLLLGMADLLLLHFTRSQKNYIQTFRLFLQGPVPFVILYMTVKMGEGKKITLIPST
jgi:hypothetical protein